MKNKKIRVNITVDKELLEEAKKKLYLFGGKLSTLFNAYLSDFVSSMNQRVSEDRKMFAEKLRELEEKIKKLEKKLEN
ncbi:hypothetical protein HYW75_01325 [Candidatus Pacearchaeota archaeon]|nr:hypothetical protein [Candidatus Pacearchaeota archaeon]